MGWVLHDQPAKGLGGEPKIASLSYAPNGTNDPDVTVNQGPPGLKAAKVTYSATGVQTITFPVDCAPPANTVFQVTAQFADLANWFEVGLVGAYNAATRQLAVQQHRSGTGQAVPANAAARVHVTFNFNNSTGV